MMTVILSISCSNKKDDTAGYVTLKNPSEVSATRTGRTTVLLSWKDNSELESGFSIWLREIDNLQNIKEIKRVGKDVTEAVIDEALVEGKGYYLGVKAEGEENVRSSEIEYVVFNMVPFDEIPSITISGKPVVSWASIVLGYELSGIQKDPGAKYGLCWSEGHVPTDADELLFGPKPADKSSRIFQAVPNTLLKEGTEYTFRAFLISSSGKYYSEPVTLTLKPQPSEKSLTWKKLSNASLPAEIEVYETTSQLSGRPFHAWYAIGDLSKGNVVFKVQVPNKAITIDNQAGEDCYILVNGGYFWNGTHTGLAILGNTVSGSINPVRGSLRRTDPEYDVMYNVTRGVFGIDNSDKPFVCWAATAKDGKHYYFGSPVPSVKGEAKYGPISASTPHRTEPNPKFALSAGPVLLYDGKCPFDFLETEKGTEYYMNNFEIMPYDIFGPNVIADRTAVGYTEDGRIVIFICDGRIAESKGANLVELAMVMKGIGCRYAVNFDGGGSTGMMIAGEHINDQTPNNRPVVSTLGFFKNNRI